MWWKNPFAFIAVCFLHVTWGEKILGVFPAFGYSQYILSSSLMKSLAERGHEVTFVCSFRQKNPVKNLKEVYLEGFHDSLHTSQVNLYDFESKIPLIQMTNVQQLGFDVTEYTISHVAFQNLLKSEQHFDLVIVEVVMTEALYALSWHFKAPLVLFVPLGANEWVNGKAGNPAPFSYVPYTYSDHNSHMTFWQRLKNCLYHTGDTLYRHLHEIPRHSLLVQKYFPGAPDLQELMYNASLFLLYSHVSATDPVPLMHNMVEVGGFHIAPKKLPKELQQFLDEAEEGVVYFSMGSNVRSRNMSEDTRSAFVSVFSKLKQKVLWKWEEDNLPNQPPNVLIRKWLPQQDVLVHPNVKAFITHGGLLSTLEAVYAGVPLVGIPIFFDQKMNMRTAVSKGYSILLPYHEINEKTLGKALDDILNNPKYKRNAQKFSTIFRDQETKPMDRAIYWIEYVLRHKGARHLRSAALDLSWYQYFALDVTLFLIVSSLCAAFIFWMFLKIIYRCFYYNDKGGEARKKLR